MKIFANCERLLRPSWNGGHGNKILHLYFLLNLAKRKGLQPVINCNSTLDDFFDLSLIKLEENCPKLEIYTENEGFPTLHLVEKIFYRSGFYNLSPYKIKVVAEANELSFIESLNLLNDYPIRQEGFFSGHFWHYALMPKIEIIEKFIKLQPFLYNLVNEKYSELIKDEKHIAVHLRETDFKHHLRHIFKKSISLPDAYYEKAIIKIEEDLGKNLTYHLFSDNIERIKSIFKNKKVIIHNDSAAIDWACLHLAKSVIQSNSSFCWSASLHHKIYSIQPKGGFNWYKHELGSIPYDFEMPFSDLIINNMK